MKVPLLEYNLLKIEAEDCEDHMICFEVCIAYTHCLLCLLLKKSQGFQYFSSVPVLHYLQAVLFIKI